MALNLKEEWFQVITSRFHIRVLHVSIEERLLIAEFMALVLRHTEFAKKFGDYILRSVEIGHWTPDTRVFIEEHELGRVILPNEEYWFKLGLTCKCLIVHFISRWN